MQNKNYGLGILGALIGGVVGSIPWIIVALTTNFFIGWLGFVIGICALYGYKKLGGIEDNYAKWIILFATLISVVFAQFFTLCFEIYQLGYEVSLDNITLIFQDGEVVKSFLINIGIGSLIAFFGIKSLFDGLGK